MTDSQQSHIMEPPNNHLEDPSTWNEQVAARYDTPGEGMFADEILKPTVDLLESLAQGKPVLEFAIGTGRVAIPLHERGIQVAGIDYSAAMVEVLKRKTGQEAIPVTLGDMTCTRVDGTFSLVYLVFNGLSNLLTQEAQIACFQNAADHLDVGGRFVVEMWIPELRKLPPGQRAVVWDEKPGYIGLDTYDILNQLVTSHHFSFDDSEKAVLFRSRHRYIWPAEQDLMARLAGFELEDRYAGWKRTPFDAEARSQISVYINR